MTFLWPQLLLSLLVIPLLIAFYIWILRKKRKYAVRFSSLSIIKEALPKRSSWRQHIPFVLFLLSISSLVVASSRPQNEVEIPLSRTTIMIAIDVSRSMCATDIKPNRLTVAQEAALNFIEEQADHTRIGIVAFAGFAEIIVPPTNDKEILTDAVENFTTSIGTAIGSATLKSIDAIAEINTTVAPSGVDLSADEDGSLPVEGFFKPDIIVVLTDGANTQGPLPLDAAQQAADRQVRIFTIGFGSSDPERMICTPQQLGSDTFSEGFGRGSFPDPGGFDGRFRQFLIIDEETLQGMAEMTGGLYFRAEDADQLYEIFIDLPNEIILQKEFIEISVMFTILAAILATAALILAIVWHRFQ